MDILTPKHAKGILYVELQQKDDDEAGMRRPGLPMTNQLCVDLGAGRARA